MGAFVPQLLCTNIQNVLLEQCGTASSLSLSLLHHCGNRDGWLVAWDLRGFMLIRFSTVWLIPFTPL